MGRWIGIPVESKIRTTSLEGGRRVSQERVSNHENIPYRYHPRQEVMKAKALESIHKI